MTLRSPYWHSYNIRHGSRTESQRVVSHSIGMSREWKGILVSINIFTNHKNVGDDGDVKSKLRAGLRTPFPSFDYPVGLAHLVFKSQALKFPSIRPQASQESREKARKNPNQGLNQYLFIYSRKPFIFGMVIWKIFKNERNYFVLIEKFNRKTGNWRKNFLFGEKQTIGQPASDSSPETASRI